MPKIEELLTTLSPGARAMIEIDHRIDHVVAIIRGTNINEQDFLVKIFENLRTAMVTYKKNHPDIGAFDITFDNFDETINFHVGRVIFILIKSDIMAIHDAQICD